MKFLAFKIVETSDATKLGAYMDLGFTVQRIQGVNATAPATVAKSAIKPVRRRRRRRKAPNKITPQLVNEMRELRKKGLVYRVIGRRFGVSGSRACQIVNQSEASA